MTSSRHYLDHASTTPLRPEAREAMQAWLSEAGKPDGVGDAGRIHEEGRRARHIVEQARESVAQLLGTEPSRVIFTSGGTEAVNAAVFAAARLRPGLVIVASKVEHSSVREASARAGQVLDLAVDHLGRVDLGDLDKILGESRPGLVNCQFANHEVGTLQPVIDVVAKCKPAGVLVHIDACAAAGHVVIDFDSLGVDYLSVSAHKLGGPPGIGALLVRRGLRTAPLLVGGSEERARRAGAENVIGAAGFGAACMALAEPGRLEAEAAAARDLTTGLVTAALSVPDLEQLGDPIGRVPHIACVNVGGVKGEAVLLDLDRAGVAAHSGSACSSEVLEPSPVLEAMGAPADQSLRLSVGWSTTPDDVSAFAASFGDIVAKLRSLTGTTT